MWQDCNESWEETMWSWVLPDDNNLTCSVCRVLRRLIPYARISLILSCATSSCTIIIGTNHHWPIMEKMAPISTSNLWRFHHQINGVCKEYEYAKAIVAKLKLMLKLASSRLEPVFSLYRWGIWGSEVLILSNLFYCLRWWNKNKCLYIAIWHDYSFSF